MNFDNQGIVSGTFLRQRWVLLLVDWSIYFTETFCKFHFIAIEYTTSPEKYWNFTKLKTRLQHRCFLVKLAEFLRTSIFKNICERLFLQDITEKDYLSISVTKLLGLYNYFYNLWGGHKVSLALLCSYSFW